MINKQVAIHYAVNVYHVNSVGGIEDIEQYSEIPHVLIGCGNTISADPYFGDEDDCSLMWENLVWAGLYGDGMKTPLIDSHPTNRTYIDIIADGVDFHEDNRKVRAIFKIIDGKMCELWWLNGSKENDSIWTVIENYKTFCEMNDPCVYTQEFREFVRARNKNNSDWPFILEFFHANLFHTNIVDVMYNIISKDVRLQYVLNFPSLTVSSPYKNQSVMDNADLGKKVLFALSVTYMHHVCAKFLEGDLYFRNDIDKYRDNPFIPFIR